MYAVIKTGGKQYCVREGDVLRVEKLEADVDSDISFEEVLMVGDGDNVTTGAPLVGGAAVSATVKSQARDRKVKILKFKRRKNYKRTAGHRQHYTEVVITGINAG